MAATRRLASEPVLTLVRPLLQATRREIREYLAGLGQSYRDDVSNVDCSRTRARLRHDLLPKLAAEYNPDVAGALVRLGSAGSVARASARGRPAHAGSSGGALTSRRIVLYSSMDFLRSIPPFVRAEVLRRVWRRAGWPEASMSATALAAAGSHWLAGTKFPASRSAAVSRYRPTGSCWFCAVSIIQRHPPPQPSPSNRFRSWFPVARRSPGPGARSKSASIPKQGPSATKRSTSSNWLCRSSFAVRRPAIGSTHWACLARARRWRISFEAVRSPANSVRTSRWCATRPASSGSSGTGSRTGSKSPWGLGGLWA